MQNTKKSYKRKDKIVDSTITPTGKQVLHYCGKCDQPIGRFAQTCPHCGAEVEYE